MSDPVAELVDAYFAYRRTGDEGLSWAWDEVEELVRDDPAQAWTVLVRLVRDAPDDAALYYVAAGPLETFLGQHGPEHLGTVLTAAAADERLRRALGGVWGRDAMPATVWKAIQTVAIPEGPLGAHAFEVSSPLGWLMDDARGRARAVYHPSEAAADESDVVLLVDAGWRSPDARGLADFIRADLVARAPPGEEIGVEDAGTLATGAGPAPVRRLALPGGQAALVAYAEAPRVVFLLVLLARTANALDAAAPALAEFGRSFRLTEPL